MRTLHTLSHMHSCNLIAVFCCCFSSQDTTKTVKAWLILRRTHIHVQSMHCLRRYWKKAMKRWSAWQWIIVLKERHKLCLASNDDDRRHSEAASELHVWKKSIFGIDLPTLNFENLLETTFLSTYTKMISFWMKWKRNTMHWARQSQISVCILNFIPLTKRV